MIKYKIIIPRNIEELLDLALRNAAKHAADGASSLLNNLQDFSWNSIAATVPVCRAKHIEGETLRRRLRDIYPERDRMLHPLDAIVRATRDYLLGVYRATPTRLGDWGFDVVVSGKRPRVLIPTNPKQLLALANLIYQKHQADGATSILNGMQEYSWTVLGPTIQPCLDKHLEAESHESQMDEAYQIRNQLFPPINDTVRATRDLLEGAFPKTLTHLGDWGFEVVQVTRKPRGGADGGGA